MSSQETEWIDAIVVGFDEEERILAYVTVPVEHSLLAKFIGREAVYEDFNGNIWRGRIVDSTGDFLIIVFGAEGSLFLPPGLGAGSLLKLPAGSPEK